MDSSTVTVAPITGRPELTTTTPTNRVPQDYVVALAIFLSLLGVVIVLVSYMWYKNREKKELKELNKIFHQEKR